MSDRADIVIVHEGNAEIWHWRWGATVLLSMLIEGPDKALASATDGAERTDQLDDILAGAVIDRDGAVLVVTGPAEVITSGGFVDGARVHLAEEAIADRLAALWPGWRVAYEPRHAVAPLLAHVRAAGVALAASSGPDSLADARQTPRWERFAYESYVDPAAAPSRDLVAPALESVAIDPDVLSMRSASELEDAGITTWGELMALSDAQQGARGLSDKARRELAEVLEGVLASG